MIRICLVDRPRRPRSEHQRLRRQAFEWGRRSEQHAVERQSGFQRKGSTGTDPQDDTTSNPGSSGKGAEAATTAGPANRGRRLQRQIWKRRQWQRSGSGSGSSGGGSSGKSPVLLDLEGNGFDVNPLTSSHFFADLNGDGHSTRMAWAGAGTGVLMIDADGNGKISQEKEFVFTNGTPTRMAISRRSRTFRNQPQWQARRRRRALGRVQGLGERRPGNARLARHRVHRSDGKGTGQTFSDGSAITGTTTFTGPTAPRGPWETPC